jgi:hypothetical protein
MHETSWAVKPKIKVSAGDRLRKKWLQEGKQNGRKLKDHDKKDACCNANSGSSKNKIKREVLDGKTLSRVEVETGLMCFSSAMRTMLVKRFGKQNSAALVCMDHS